MLQGFFQIVLILAILAIVAPLLGRYMAQVFLGEKTWLDRIISPVERLVFAGAGVLDGRSMTGGQYMRAVLISNLVMMVLVYAIFMLQGVLPLNPTGLPAPS